MNPIFGFPHFRISIFALFLIFTFSSCSVEKRRYMDGYHVQWKKRTERAPELAVQQNQESQAATDIVQAPEAEKPEDREEPIVQPNPSNEVSDEIKSTTSKKEIVDQTNQILPEVITTLAKDHSQNEPVPEEVKEEYKRLQNRITWLVIQLVLCFLFTGILLFAAVYSSLISTLAGNPQNIFSSLPNFWLVVLVISTLMTYFSVASLIKAKAHQKKLLAEYPDLDPKKRKQEEEVAASRKTDAEKRYNTLNVLAYIFCTLFIFLTCVFLIQHLILAPFWLLGTLTASETTILLISLTAIFVSLGLWLLFRKIRSKIAH